MKTKPFKWLTGGPRLKLVTQLSQEEFVAQFERSVDRPRFTLFGDFSGSTPFIGNISDIGFTLMRRSSWPGKGPRVSFQGQLQRTESGSEINGSFNLPIAARAFVIVWFLFAVFFSMIGCFAAVSLLLEGHRNGWWAILIAAATLGSLVFAAAFMAVLRKSEEALFLRFFAETFGASLVERSE